MSAKSYLLFLIANFFSFCPLFSQTNFYATDTIQVIEITFSQSNWDYMLDTAKHGSEGYLMASKIKINGVSFDSVGVKYKGFSSYDSSRVKNPLHIKLDYYYKTANYNGVEDIKLSNGFSDPSCIREVLGYEILRNYMDAPQSNFAKVYINGIYYGVYSNSEDIDKKFLTKKFYSSENSFFKCNPANLVSGQIPNLLYFGADSANYYSRYEIKSKIKWKDIIDLCDTLCNKSTHIDSILDVDRALWMLAFNNVLVNLDSYTGAFSQNYYLYRDDNRRFVPIIWDLNMCFGGFQNTGSGQLSIAGMKQMTPLLHSTNGARPLIMNLLANATYKKMYITHMRTITSEFFSNSNYLSRAQTLQALIDSSVKSETHSLYSYSQFQSSLTTNIGVIPGIASLMGARDTFLRNTTQFQQAAPVIANIATAPSVINLNDTIWIACKATNQDFVKVGWRDQPFKRFRSIQMMDDGKHHDGIAGDSVYGANIIGSSNQIQYYIYAENVNAGIFSPARAEHEFYSVNVNVITPTAGQIVFNEFLSLNVNDAINEFGMHEDWIELYNTTGMPLNVYGLYLTDDTLFPARFALPNKVIQPNGYLTIWADGKTSTTSYIHSNFSLSSAGEKIVLSNGKGVIVDSVTYGLQLQDTSYGRCPNGTGGFSKQKQTTFHSQNSCGINVDEYFLPTVYIKSYPNPADSRVTIVTDNKSPMNVIVINSIGEIVYSNEIRRQLTMNVETFPSGLYMIHCGLAKNKILIQH